MNVVMSDIEQEAENRKPELDTWKRKQDTRRSKKRVQTQTRNIYESATGRRLPSICVHL